MIDPEELRTSAKAHLTMNPTSKQIRLLPSSRVITISTFSSAKTFKEAILKRIATPEIEMSFLEIGMNPRETDIGPMKIEEAALSSFMDRQVAGIAAETEINITLLTDTNTKSTKQSTKGKRRRIEKKEIEAGLDLRNGAKGTLCREWIDKY